MLCAHPLRRSAPLAGLLFAAVALLLAAPGLTQTAHACGGFWCSQAAPVVQSAERIVFIDHGDGSMSAVIEIQYQGPSEDFAWVIPMPGKPEIAIASTLALDRLDAFSAPSYELERVIEGTCRVEVCNVCGGSAAGAGGSFSASGGTGGGGPPAISVVDQGTVGPYEYATIAVDPSLDEPAQTAIDWFRDNGYDLTGVDEAVLGPYLADGLNLLAFKLTKSAQQSSGALRPVMLTFQATKPSIPIRPTAVAAQPDMGVLVWIVAEARAVPENYKSLILNDALINWFDPFSTYRDVVTRAADEAGGQGFTTELAGPSSEAAEVVFTRDEAQALDQLEHGTYAQGIDALWAANSWYRDWEGWRDAVAASVQLPDGVSLDDFASSPDSYRDTAVIDPETFIAALHQYVIDPVRDTQKAIASRPYLTRLFTTMSAEEMTHDPVFTYNEDLPELGSRRVATQFIECSPNVTQSEAPWRVELRRGEIIRGVGFSWPLDADTMPAARTIEQLTNTGQGTVLIDNAEKITHALAGLPEPTPAQMQHPGMPPTNAYDGSGPQDQSCSVSLPGAARRDLQAIALACALAASIGARRRGRRSER